MLDAEAEMHSSSFKNIILEADIPSRNLEYMQQVLGHIFLFHFLVHDIFNVFEFEFALSIDFHKTLV